MGSSGGGEIEGDLRPKAVTALGTLETGTPTTSTPPAQTWSFTTLSSPSSPTEPRSRSGAPYRFPLPTFQPTAFLTSSSQSPYPSIPLLLLFCQKRRTRSQLIPDALAESPCLGLYSSSLVSSARRSYSYVVFRLTSRPDLTLLTPSLPALLRPFPPLSLTHWRPPLRPGIQCPPPALDPLVVVANQPPYSPAQSLGCSLLSRVARQVPFSVPSFVFFVRPSQGLVARPDHKQDRRPSPNNLSFAAISLFSNPVSCLSKKAKTWFLHRGAGIESQLILEPPSSPPAAPRSPAAAPRAAQDRCLATPFVLFQTHQISVRRPCAGAPLEITSDSREQVAETKEDVIDPRERL